jgi:hypothetical protein
MSNKDKQQLNVSPMAHAGIVSLVTLYFGWSCVASGRDLHSSTFQLNLSRFLSSTPPTDTEYRTKRAYVELPTGQV